MCFCSRYPLQDGRATKDKRTAEIFATVHKIIKNNVAPNKLVLVEVPDVTSVNEAVVVTDPNIGLCNEGQMLRQFLVDCPVPL